MKAYNLRKREGIHCMALYININGNAFSHTYRHFLHKKHNKLHTQQMSNKYSKKKKQLKTNETSYRTSLD